MEKVDDDAAAKFINALTKSVQTLCHGFLDFHKGIEIIGYINLNVDKGSNFHYVLEEKVCKNEENSTLFISNSFQAQNQKQDKGKDSEKVPGGNAVRHRSSSADNDDDGKVSTAISSISSALSRSNERNRSGSGAKDSESHSRHVSNTAKRKASDDGNSDVRSAKSSHTGSSPVSHFFSQSPHARTGLRSPVDSKPSLSELRGEDMSGTVLPQTAGVSGDGAGDLGVNLAGSVLERVDDHSNSDLPDRGDDSDGDLEVTFIKEEYHEGEQSSCQFENSGGQQFGRGLNRRGSGDNMPDPMYPVSMHPSASATYVPSAQDMAAAQHYGPSTSQPGTSGHRGTRGKQGAPWQLRHTQLTGVRVGEASFDPPLAHQAHPTLAHQVAAVPVLDLSIKSEPTDPDFYAYNCEQRRRKNSVLANQHEGETPEETRLKAKEKSKLYRQKQKLHRMTDSAYDMVFRHQVAERKRRQRMREKINKYKLFGADAGLSIAK